MHATAPASGEPDVVIALPGEIAIPAEDGDEYRYVFGPRFASEAVAQEVKRVEILNNVPYAAIGVLVTLWLFDVTISIVVMIGVIMLAGIVVNNGILLIDYTNQLRQEGRSKIESLIEAGQVRMRRS